MKKEEIICVNLPGNRKRLLTKESFNTKIKTLIEDINNTDVYKFISTPCGVRMTVDYDILRGVKALESLLLEYLKLNRKSHLLDRDVLLMANHCIGIRV